jgi:hypothetical protein
LLLLAVSSIFGVSSATAEDPNVGLLRVAEVRYPRQVAPSSQFSLAIDVQYAIRTNASVKSSLFKGSMASLNSELWHSDPIAVTRGGDRLWTVNLTAPSNEQDLMLTAVAYYLKDGTWQYYSDKNRGPGFVEFTIKIAKLATLEIALGIPNVTVKVDDSSARTTDAGIVALQLSVGTSHRISVPNLVAFENSTRLVFSGWKDKENSTDRTTLLDGNSKLVGSYATQYMLRVNSIVPAYSQTAWYQRGANVSLETARSLPLGGPLEFLGLRYEFKDWSGDFASTSSAINFTMDRPKVLNANFVVDYAPLVLPTVLVIGLLGGVVLVSLRRKRTKSITMEEEGVGEVASPRLCESCAEPVEEDWTHCVHCGKKLGPSEPIQG